MVGMNEVIGGTVKDGLYLIRRKKGNTRHNSYYGFRVFRNLRTFHIRYDCIIDGISKGHLHEASDLDTFCKFVSGEIGESYIVYRPSERYDFYEHSRIFGKEI